MILEEDTKLLGITSEQKPTTI